MSIDTYYTVLGVGENASRAEIKTAYRELVRQVHPDSVPNASPYWKRAAEEKTKEINEAYSVLFDVKKRREYDRLLAEARQDQEQPQPAVDPASPPTQQSAPQPQPQQTVGRPKRSFVVGIGDATVLGLFLLFVAAIIFLLLRTMWGAFLSSAIFAAVLCWRKLFTVFPQYRRWCVVGLAVSVCFVVADLLYPAEESKPAQVAPVSAPKPGPTPLQLRAQDVEIEQPKRSGEPALTVATRTTAHPSGVSTQHLPNGVFSADPMEGYGETKMFMGIECSWKNVDAESRKRWVETGAIPNHTFLIAPNGDTCFIWDRDVGIFLAKGAARGTLVTRGGSVVGYERSEVNSAVFEKPSVELHQSPPSTEVATAKIEQPASKSSLTGPEEQSIESVCSTAKYLQGPAAYNQCRARQLELWAAGPRRPDLSGLTYAEQQSIESVCSTAKHLQGPAAYDQCLVRQLQQWAAGPKRPDLSGLSYEEQQSIESVCSTAKHLQGPAAYNQCLISQLEQRAAGPRRPDLSGLSYEEQQSIESVCSTAKHLQGPAAYNQCLVRQLQQWAAGPRRPNLSRLSYAEQQSIESACSTAKHLQGPAAYNECLVRQMQSLSYR